MNDKEMCNSKFDFLCAKMIEFNNRINQLEGVEDQSALSYENFILLSQAFRKGLEDAD